MKLALNHANIFSKQQTVGQISDHELLSPDNSWSGWDNALLVQKVISGGGLQFECPGMLVLKNIHSGGHLFRTGEKL